jgi:hypothetical protein
VHGSVPTACVSHAAEVSRRKKVLQDALREADLTSGGGVHARVQAQVALAELLCQSALKSDRLEALRLLSQVIADDHNQENPAVEFRRVPHELMRRCLLCHGLASLTLGEYRACRRVCAQLLEMNVQDDQALMLLAAAKRQVEADSRTGFAILTGVVAASALASLSLLRHLRNA